MANLPTKTASQNVDYLRVGRGTTQTFTAIDQAVIFTDVNSGNTPVNTTNGQITLSVGKTYNLRGAVNSVSGVVAPRSTFGWFNVTAGNYIGNPTSFYAPADTAANGAGQGIAEAVITPTVPTIVEFRLNGGYQPGISIVLGDFNAPGAETAWATVSQLGSTALIGQTTVNGGVVFGNGTALVQDASNLFYDDINNRLGIGTNTPTAKTQIVSTTTANANGEPVLKLSTNYGGGLLPGAGGSLIFTDEVNTNVGEIRSLTNSPNTVGLAFSTFNGGVLSERLRISPSGMLGVGLTTPLNNIHIGAASIANTGGVRLPITSASASQPGSQIGVNADGDIVKLADQSIDYVNVKRSGSLIGVGSGTSILYNTITSGNIPYNTTNGQFSLTAGKTYRLTGSAVFFDYSNPTSGRMDFEWVDGTTEVALVGNPSSVYVNSSTDSGSSNPIVELIYTPVANQTVKIKIISANGVANLDAVGTRASIQQLIPTLNTVGGIPAVDQSSSGYFDIGNMRVAWGKTASTSDDDEFFSFPVSFAAPPVVTATIQVTVGGNYPGNVGVPESGIKAVTTTSFIYNRDNSIANTDNPFVNWHAFGQKP